MFRMLIGRCHVSESNSQVIRYVISRMKEGRKSWLKVSRNERKEFMRQMIAIHKENRDLYRDVMSGNLNTTDEL